ncbi:MAG: hypothetical protein MHM6MM_002747 [Cercozoa sp. M6MM]
MSAEEERLTPEDLEEPQWEDEPGQKKNKRRQPTPSDEDEAEAEAEEPAKKKARKKIDVAKYKRDDTYCLVVSDKGTMKWVQVSKFRGKKLVRFSQYYEDKQTGEPKNGSKGCSFTEEQWDFIRDNVDVIDAMVSAMK